MIRVTNGLKSLPDALHQLSSSTVKLTKVRLRVINVFTGAVAPFVNLRNALIRPFSVPIRLVEPLVRLMRSFHRL